MSAELTRADLFERIHAVAEEILEYNPEATSTDDLYDEIHEQADSLVSVYYYANAQEWLLANMPDPEDYGLETALEPTDDINRRISVAMYGWYADELRLALEDLLEKKETN